MTATRRIAKTTVTVQLDVEYDSRYVQISDISGDLAKRLVSVCEAAPFRGPAEDYASWWTQAVRTYDEAVEPIGFQGLATSFDQLGMALDEYDDGEITIDQLLETIREQLGEREANR